jgi:hypothetical protein
MEKEISQFCALTGWNFGFLESYSSMLSRIREMLSSIKSDITVQFADSLLKRRLQIAKLNWGEKRPAHEPILTAAVKSVMNTVMTVKVVVFDDHLLTFLPRILAAQDV